MCYLVTAFIFIYRTFAINGVGSACLERKRTKYRKLKRHLSCNWRIGLIPTKKTILKNQCFCTHALNCMHLLHTRTCTHLVTQNFFFLPSYHYLFHLARKRTLCSFYICSDINTTCISLQSLIFCLIITCNNNRYWFSQCLLVG